MQVAIFDGLTGLEWLFLIGNSLTTLDADIFVGLAALQNLRLDGNNLTALETELFDPLDESLFYLYLGDNKLTTLDKDIFEGLTALQNLRLEGNNLAALETELFDPLGDSLSQLVLTDNSLTELPADIFAGLTALKGLDLSCNELTALELTRFDPFAASLTFLDITGNSFTVQPTEDGCPGPNSPPSNNTSTSPKPTPTALFPPTPASASSASAVADLFPKFVAPGTDVYTARLAHDVSSMTVTVAARDPKAVIEPRSGGTYLYDNDPGTDGLQIDMLSARAHVGWTVRARNGIDFSYYQIGVYHDHPPATVARLRGLTLSGVPLTGPFDSRTYAYTADTDATTTTVTPELSDPDATFVVKLNDVTDLDGTVSLAMGANLITVEVTAEDRATMLTYRVTVTLARSSLSSLSVADAAGTEGDDVVFTVTLSEAAAAAVTATWTASIEDGDTAGEADLGMTRTGTVSIANGGMTGTFMVPTAEDSTDETDETFTVRLSGVSTNAQLASDPTATGTIIDDDPVGMGGICDRTPRIRDRILTLLKYRHSFKDGCGDVNETHLAKLKSLDLGRNPSTESAFHAQSAERRLRGAGDPREAGPEGDRA